MRYSVAMGTILGLIFDSAMTGGAMELEKRYSYAWIFTRLLPGLFIVGVLLLIGIFNGWS